MSPALATAGTRAAPRPDGRDGRAPLDDGDRAADVALAREVGAGVERVVLGRRAAVELVVVAVLARGHVLLQDVPGSGKTTLARGLAATLGGRFSRVSGTADLLPADVTGGAVWQPADGGTTFVPGPVFCDVLLADELNRVPPRTQSAFFEVMDERAATVDGVRHALADGFVLLATQNPLDTHGTYPLPEGQLDRFAVTVRLGPNAPAVERAVVRAHLLGAPAPADLPAVLVHGDLARLQAAAAATHVSDPVLDLAVRLAEATRTEPDVLLGASTRAALVLVRCAQARALLAGRPHVLPDDVQELAVPVLAHRLVLRGPDWSDGPDALGQTGAGAAADVVERLVARVPALPL